VVLLRDGGEGRRAAQGEREETANHGTSVFSEGILRSSRWSPTEADRSQLLGRVMMRQQDRLDYSCIDGILRADAHRRYSPEDCRAGAYRNLARRCPLAHLGRQAPWSRTSEPTPFWWQAA
jgi:hypothetical protein